MFLGLIVSGEGSIKTNNDVENAHKAQFKIWSINWLKPYMKTVLIAFFKKQTYHKVKFLKMFRYNCNEDFIP